MVRRLTLLMSMLALAATAGVAQPQQSQGPARRQGQPPTRDATQTPTGTASLAGRVLTADTGRPVKRARITASAGGRQSRTTSTDDQGRFQIASLPAGSYTVTAFKNGFVNATYGQRRPLQPGTPVELR